jgi:hypothetical protein
LILFQISKDQLLTIFVLRDDLDEEEESKLETEDEGDVEDENDLDNGDPA